MNSSSTHKVYLTHNCTLTHTNTLEFNWKQNTNISHFVFFSSMTTTSSTETLRRRTSSTPPAAASRWGTLASAQRAAPMSCSVFFVALRRMLPRNCSRTKVISATTQISGLWASSCTSWWRPLCRFLGTVWAGWSAAYYRGPTVSLNTCNKSVRWLLKACCGLCLLTAPLSHRFWTVRGSTASNAPRIMPCCPCARSTLARLTLLCVWRSRRSKAYCRISVLRHFISRITPAQTVGAPWLGLTEFCCIGCKRGGPWRQWAILHFNQTNTGGSGSGQ